MNTMLHFRVLILFAAFALSGLRGNAQIHEGISGNIGFGLGMADWPGYENLFAEFNELRPWLTKPADLVPRRYGYSFGLGTSGEHVLYQYNYASFKTSTHVAGTDTSGNELSMTYIVKNRALELMFGGYLLNREHFRIGLLGGLTINSVILKTTNKSAAERAAATFFRIMIIGPFGSAARGVNYHFYLGGKVALPIAFGEKQAFCIEPFCALSFWKVSVAKDRKILNGETSAYPEDHFKGAMNSWGVRAIYCFGFD